MAEMIQPAMVPKVKLYTGEEIPCVGMGTFGSDRFSTGAGVQMQWQEQSAADTVCLTVRHVMEMKIRLERYSMRPLMKVL